MYSPLFEKMNSKVKTDNTYLVYMKATDKSQAKQADIDTLAREIKKGWWSKNRERFILKIDFKTDTQGK